VVAITAKVIGPQGIEIDVKDAHDYLPYENYKLSDTLTNQTFLSGNQEQMEEFRKINESNKFSLKFCF